jgi:hypothetical protein
VGQLVNEWSPQFPCRARVCVVKTAIIFEPQTPANYFPRRDADVSNCCPTILHGLDVLQNVEALLFSEPSVDVYQSTRRHEGSTLRFLTRF